MVPAALVLGALLAIGVGRAGAVVVQRQRAQIAADAAALAGVHGGRATATAVATANGASLQSFAVRGDEVLVTVTVGAVDASARATDGP
jgi:hypothetical protein